MKKLIALFLLLPLIAFAQGNTNRVIFSNPSNQFTGTFTGNAGPLTNLQAGNLVSPNIASGLTYSDDPSFPGFGYSPVSLTIGRVYFFTPGDASSFIFYTGTAGLDGNFLNAIGLFTNSQSTVYFVNTSTTSGAVTSQLYLFGQTNFGTWAGILESSAVSSAGAAMLNSNQTFTGINLLSNSDFRGSNYLGRATVITNTTGLVSGTINTFLLTASSNGFSSLLFGDDIVIGNAQYCVLAVTNSTTAVVQLLPNGPLAASYTNSTWNIYRCAAYITDINGTIVGAIRGDGGVLLKSGPAAGPSSAFFGVFAGIDNATSTPYMHSMSGGNKTMIINAPNANGGGAITVHPGATFDSIAALDNSWLYAKVGITNSGDEVLNGTYTRNTTNAAPNAVTVGTTVPDLWFPIINGSTTYYMPAWKAH